MQQRNEIRFKRIHVLISAVVSAVVSVLFEPVIGEMDVVEEGGL